MQFLTLRSVPASNSDCVLQALWESVQPFSNYFSFMISSMAIGRHHGFEKMWFLILRAVYRLLILLGSVQILWESVHPVSNNLPLHFLALLRMQLMPQPRSHSLLTALRWLVDHRPTYSLWLFVIVMRLQSVLWCHTLHGLITALLLSIINV